MTKLSLSLVIMLSLVTVHPAAAAPGAPTLIAPSGSVVGTTIAFSWQAVPEAEFYYVFILGALTSGASQMSVGYCTPDRLCGRRSDVHGHAHATSQGGDLFVEGRGMGVG